MIRDFEPGPGSSLVENLVALGGRIYFTAWDERHGTELWRHDPGTGRLMETDDERQTEKRYLSMKTV
jgi:hypothetical protein